MCKPVRWRTTSARQTSLVRPLSRHILQKHVDVIKSLCSTVKSVNRGSKGNGDTGKLEERVRKLHSREWKRSERRTSSRGLSNFIPSDSRLPMNQSTPPLNTLIQSALSEIPLSRCYDSISICYLLPCAAQSLSPATVRLSLCTRQPSL